MVSEAGVEPIAHPFALTTGFLLDAAQLESDPDDRHLRNVAPANLIALGKSRTWTADE